MFLYLILLPLIILVCVWFSYTYYITYIKEKNTEHLGSYQGNSTPTGAELSSILTTRDPTYDGTIDPSSLTVEMKRKEDPSAKSKYDANAESGTAVHCDTFTECPNNIFKPNHKEIVCIDGKCSEGICCDNTSSNIGTDMVDNIVKFKDVGSDLMQELGPLFEIIGPPLMAWGENLKLQLKLDRMNLEQEIDNIQSFNDTYCTVDEMDSKCKEDGKTVDSSAQCPDGLCTVDACCVDTDGSAGGKAVGGDAIDDPVLDDKEDDNDDPVLVVEEDGNDDPGKPISEVTDISMS